MNIFTSLHQQTPPLKRKWEEEEEEEEKEKEEKPNHISTSSSSSSNNAPTLISLHPTTPPSIFTPNLSIFATIISPPRKPLDLPAVDMAALRSVIPPVTVVLEGRAICHRIRLHEHRSYGSLASALHRMFVDVVDSGEGDHQDLDLSNAVPGHVVAYEDMDDDLLLAGDLSWKDFVSVVKRIRILPEKSNRRRNGNPPAATL